MMMFRGGMTIRFRQLIRTRPLWPLGAVLSFALPGIAHANDAIVARPSSAWELEYAEEHCGLKRFFLGGEHQFAVEIRKYSPDDSIEMMIFSKTLRRSGRDPVSQIGSHGEERKHNYFFKIKSGEWDGVRLNLGSDYFSTKQSDENGPALTRFHLRDAMKQDVTFELEELHGALQAMDACTASLVSGWGLNPEIQRGLSRRISNDNLDWKWMVPFIRKTKSLRNKLGDITTRLLLIVEADGKASSCKQLRVPQEDKVHRKACKDLMDDAKFEPALDAEAKPVRSYLLISVSTARQFVTIGS